MSRKTPERVIHEALRLARAGNTPRAVAAQIAKKFHRPCSTSAVRVWVAKAKAAADAPPIELTAHPEPEVPPSAVEADVEGGDGDSLYDRTLKMINRAQARASRAEADGNHAAAQKAQRDAATLLPVLARLDKDRKANTDSVTFSREKLEKARRTIAERIAALIADLDRTGGIVCSGCGRQIRLNLAKGE